MKENGCVVAILWCVALVVLGSTDEGLGNLFIWGSVIAGGVFLWDKSEPDRRKAKGKKQAEQARAAAAIEDERANAQVADWTKRRFGIPDHAKIGEYRPGPASEVASASPALERLRTVRVRVSSDFVVAIPDAKQAHGVFERIALGLVEMTSKEGESLAACLRALVVKGFDRGSFRFQDMYPPHDWGPVQHGSRPTLGTMPCVVRIHAWADARRTLVRPFDRDAADRLDAVVRRTEGIIRDVYSPALAFEPGQPVLHAGQWEKHLPNLQAELASANDRLATFLKQPPRPRLQPPEYAIFKHDVVASTIAEQITDFLTRQSRRFEALSVDPSLIGTQETEFGAWLLEGFLTGEVPARFRKATIEWFESVTTWDERTADPRLRAQLHLVCMAFSMNYLLEVLKRMPEYADRSGQGKKLDGIVVNGNVGVINTAESLRIINSTMAGIIDRGDARTADAVSELSAAVQEDPNLTDEVRAQLLDHVADVAEAAAVPDEPRRLNRARAALASITAAAGASSRIAQVVTEWQDVFPS
ncbi:hypothetical protein [Embleya sp. NPDC059259]|uniref:hypothetical protein n=1 Tax=unclassified Embleya TaxID=2699296 RepID=UPI00369704B3